MTARMVRVERLIRRADEALGAARSASSRGARAVEEARDRVETDERAWSNHAQRFGTGVTRATDLDEQAAHLRTLRLRADAAARLLDRAVAEQRTCAAAVVKAAMELRKLELWRDRIVQGEREEENRRSQRSSDELAARAARTRP